eukprot:gene5698-biopygen9202
MNGRCMRGWWAARSPRPPGPPADCWRIWGLGRTLADFLADLADCRLADLADWWISRTWHTPGGLGNLVGGEWWAEATAETADETSSLLAIGKRLAIGESLVDIPTDHGWNPSRDMEMCSRS